MIALERAAPRAFCGFTATLAALHGVGAVGLLSPWSDAFAQLTPGFLLVMSGLVLARHRTWSRRFAGFAVGAVCVSYAVELLGVHTGAVFGDYEYGSALGPTLWGVPPIIGVLWFVLAYGVGHLTARSSLGRAGRAAMGAALLTALDWLIEPTAIRLGFWSWRDGVPPTLNFVGWFALSFCLVYAFHALRLPRENPLAERSLALLALFFAALAGFA